MSTTNQQSRRTAIQQIFMATAGLSLFSMPTLAQTKTENTVDSQNLSPFYLAPMEPLQPGPIGLDIRTWVKSSQTNMQYSCVEFAVAAKKMGPAPHYHKALDELMYVLEGTITIMIEDTIYEIPAGGWHFRPRGIVHTFFNQTDKPARAIDMYFNQNFEDYLEELYHTILPEVAAKGLKRNDPNIAKRISDLHDKFGIVGFPERKQAIMDKYGLK